MLKAMAEGSIPPTMRPPGEKAWILTVSMRKSVRAIPDPRARRNVLQRLGMPGSRTRTPPRELSSGGHDSSGILS